MTSAGEFEVAVRPLPKGGTLVRVSGELDLATAPDVEKTLSEADLASTLVFDLTECGFIDSTGVRVLLATAAKAGETGGKVSVVAPDPAVRRALEIAGLGAVLPIHTTVAAAI